MPNFMKHYSDKLVALKMRNEQRKKNYQITQGNIPRPWTAEEDKQVLAHEISDRKLAKKISRSAEAIQIRRCRLKKKLTEGSE